VKRPKPTETRDVPVMVRLYPQEKWVLDEVCKIEGVTRSALLRRLVLRYGQANYSVGVSMYEVLPKQEKQPTIPGHRIIPAGKIYG